MRVFDNDNNLKPITILLRLSADPDSIVETYTVSIKDSSGLEIGTKYYATVDSSLTDSQIETALSTEVTADENQAIDVSHNALTEITSIPNWSTWSQSDWSTYFDANLANGHVTSITNLAQAKAMMSKQNLVLNNLAKTAIAMRNKLWPDLEE